MLLEAKAVVHTTRNDDPHNYIDDYRSFGSWLSQATVESCLLTMGK